MADTPRGEQTIERMTTGRLAIGGLEATRTLSHDIPAVLVRDPEPTLKRAVRLVPHGRVRQEVEVESIVLQPLGKFHIFGPHKGLVKPADSARMRAADRGIGGVELARAW